MSRAPSTVRRKRGFLAAAAVTVPALVASVLLHTSSGPSTGAEDDAPLPPPRTLTDAEKTLLHTAEQLLLRDCMRKHGFEYEVTVEDPLPEARDFPYVLDDVAWAKEHGYGTDLRREAVRLHEEDPNQRYFRGLPPERRQAALDAANGTPPHEVTVENPDGAVLTRNAEGCQSEAERTLYGDLNAWFEARTSADALVAMRRQRVVEDSRFAEATRPWAECMRAAGHSYSSPEELRKRLPPPRNPLPREEEIRLAVVEAECAESSGLADVARELDAQHEERLRRQYRSTADAKRRLQLTALSRARSVVDGAGPGA